VCEFIGVAPYIPATISARDPWAKRKMEHGYPPVPERAKKWLTEFYKPYNDELSEYLGGDWTWQ